MIHKNLYTGWDFDTVWDIEDGECYPYLRKAEKPTEFVDPGAVYTGIGTEADPYRIHNAEGMEYIRFDMRGYYRLSADIDYDGCTLIPIGTDRAPFWGGFDGDGYTIRNFKISGTTYTGIFGCAQTAKFKNLRIENGEITATGERAGGLVGYMYKCIAENICLSGVTVNGESTTGTLAGYVYGGSFNKCCIKGKSVLTGNSGLGGLIGGVYGNSTIINQCYAEVNATGNYYIGGLIGTASATTVVSDSYATGSVISTQKSSWIGGLIGKASSVTIKNSFAAVSMDPGVYGIAYGSVKAENVYFDSTLSGVTAPGASARTTSQMWKRETYSRWDWVNTWDMKENAYPNLKQVEIISREPFKLTYLDRTCFSVLIKWQKVPGAERYDITYQNKSVSTAIPELHIENLMPDTEYEFMVCAVMSNSEKMWSRPLRIRTVKLVFLDGLHSVEKHQNTIDLAWNAVENAVGYEVIYNNHVLQSDKNSCTITGLTADVSYKIQVKALLADGSFRTGNPIIEKIYTLEPKSYYAGEFITKCKGQTWFSDEIENLLNLQGKSINTISSGEDLKAIYAIGLAQRGIVGKIPSEAISELPSLEYLFLDGNELAE